MFSKALFIGLGALALSGVSLAAPAASCAALVESTTSAASAKETTASKSQGNNNSNNKASFGSCSTPEIKFAAGLDGRRETSFIAVDQKSFNHGSADAIDVISSFICTELQSKCRGNSVAITDCHSAASAADKVTKGSGAQADAFNKVFGKSTNFGSVTQLDNQGRTVGKSGSKTTSSKGSSSTISSSSSTSVAVAANNVGSTDTNSTSTSDDTPPPTSTDSGDEQSSTTLDPAVIATGFAQDGQATQEAGQVPSLTSTNNFINFCLTVNKPITNGQQILAGSCNPAPMGVIAAQTNMPSSKFTFPQNFGKVAANQNFTVTMAINNLETGNFVNAQQNYYAAPQQINANGDVIGHTHFVIQKIDSLTSTTVLDPTVFAFFKGVNTVAVDGVVSAVVAGGLPTGDYKLASINTAANHQPVLVAVAQHGSTDDTIYFTVQ